MKTWLTAISLGLAVAAAVFVLVWPIYTVHGNQPASATLVEVNGAWAAVPVTFPVVIALVPLMYRKQAVRVVAAILMGGFALIAMSIGLFYLPSAIVMVLAACVGDAAKLRDALP
jgi:hypothetical protein